MLHASDIVEFTVYPIHVFLMIEIYSFFFNGVRFGGKQDSVNHDRNTKLHKEVTNKYLLFSLFNSILTNVCYFKPKQST